MSNEDQELLAILKILYPAMSGLVTRVADKTRFSASYVLKVLQGNRSNKVIDVELASLFRRALKKKGITGLVILPGR